MAIEYQKEGHVAIFTINRPEVLNALSPDLLAEWTTALVDFRDNKDRWVGIITGAGDRAFCTGLDLRAARPGGTVDPSAGAGGTPAETLVRGLELWKPLIAAVNGYAFGGGFEIALACDVRIASDNARFGLTEVSTASGGEPPDGKLSPSPEKKTGARHASRTVRSRKSR